MGTPEGSEDKLVEKFWEKTEEPPYVHEGDQFSDLSDSKEDFPEFDDLDDNMYSASDSNLDRAASDLAEIGLPRLPTGKSERRLVKESFQRIHDSAGRIRETFFNLYPVNEINQL